MNLLCITDLHGDHDVLQYILSEAGEADVVLLGGDITNFGRPDAAESVVRAIQKRYPTVLAVAGNCDSPEIDERLQGLNVSVFGRGVTIQGVGFHGVSAMPPWMGSMYELTEQQIEDSLVRGRSELVSPVWEVLLTHTPPRASTLDRTNRGEHVGSIAVRDWIERYQPLLVVCGHIHEARGVQRIGESTVVNCGAAYRGSYVLASLNQDGVKIELRKSGQFAT